MNYLIYILILVHNLNVLLYILISYLLSVQQVIYFNTINLVLILNDNNTPVYFFLFLYFSRNIMTSFIRKSVQYGTVQYSKVQYGKWCSDDFTIIAKIKFYYLRLENKNFTKHIFSFQEI